jgi:hypothetical protein
MQPIRKSSYDFRINERGSGSEQYRPGMMLALLIYCYATGPASAFEQG